MPLLVRSQRLVKSFFLCFSFVFSLFMNQIIFFHDVVNACRPNKSNVFVYHLPDKIAVAVQEVFVGKNIFHNNLFFLRCIPVESWRVVIMFCLNTFSVCHSCHVLFETPANEAITATLISVFPSSFLTSVSIRVRFSRLTFSFPSSGHQKFFQTACFLPQFLQLLHLSSEVLLPVHQSFSAEPFLLYPAVYV